MDTAERLALVNRMVGLVNQLYILENCCSPCKNEPKTAPKTNFLLCCEPKSALKSGTQRNQLQLTEKKTRTPISTYQSDYTVQALCGPPPKQQNQDRSTYTQRRFQLPPRYPQTKSENYPQHRSHHCDATPPKTGAAKTYTPTSYKEASNTGSFPFFKNTSTYNRHEQKPCFMIKCKPHKCKTNPNDEPLITWTPVMEIRKTTNAKNLERQNDNPVTKYVYVEPPGCPYQPVWSTKDPMCEKFCGPPPDCPALGPPPGYGGEAIELCCPGGKGPPVDRWGQPYECKQTLDGRPVCVPTKEEGPTDWCDAKTTPFRQCDTMEESKRLLTRGKVLNQRKNISPVCSDYNMGKPTTSLYKRPVWPKKETCDDGKCRCPNNPGKRKLTSKPTVESRGITLCCSQL